MACDDTSIITKLADTYSIQTRDKILGALLQCPAGKVYDGLSAIEIFTLMNDFSAFLTSKAHIIGIESLIPKVLARCPQVVLYKNSGKDLRTFLKSSLISRYRISYEALVLAEKMSMTDNGYILYMTDTSLDNLVWTADGRVVPVDLDDIYVVEASHDSGTDPFYERFFLEINTYKLILELNFKD